MTKEQLRDAAMLTPECKEYQVTGRAHQEASMALQNARAKFEMAGLADQRAERAYHATPEFQALQNDWKTNEN
jgi:hypothetical protein